MSIINWDEILESGIKFFKDSLSKSEENKKAIKEFSTVKYETNNITLIEINAKNIDVKVYPESNNESKCILQGILINENSKPSINIIHENSKVSVNLKNTSKLANGEKLEVIIYIPINLEKKINVNINGTNSDILLTKYNFKNIIVVGDTGDININDLNADNINLTTETGDIIVDNICISNYNGIFKSDCGDKVIKKGFNKNSANSLICKSKTGDIIVN